jgi:hypothetical protein
MLYTIELPADRQSHRFLFPLCITTGNPVAGTLVGIRNKLHKTDSGFMFHFIKYIRFQVHFIEYNRIHKLVHENWGFI